MWTYIKLLSNNTIPASATFTAYYNGNDNIIQTEDSIKNGYWALLGVCQADTEQITSGLTANSTYDIWVSSGVEAGHAAGTIGNHDPSYTSKGSPSDPLLLSASNYLATPANFIATGQAGSISLTWQAATGASGYTIYRRPATGYSATAIVYERVAQETTNSWTDNKVTAGKTYYYIIVATAAGKRSGHSSEISAALTGGAIVTLTSISVLPASVNLNASGQQAFTVTAKYSDNSTKNVTSTWSGATKGTMVGNTYTAPAAITADETLNLTASYTEGSITKTALVTVNLKSAAVVPGALSSINVSPSQVILEVGDSQQFSAKGYDKNGIEIAGLTFSYSSAFGNNSLITATKTGDYTLTVSSGSIKGTASIKVIPALNEIKFGSSSYIVNASGTTINMPVIAVDTSGSTVTGVSGYTFDTTGKEYGNIIDQNGNFKAGTKEGAYTVTVKLMTKNKTLSANTTVYLNLGGPKISASVNGEEIKSGSTISPKPKITINLSDGNGVKSVSVYMDGIQVSTTGLQTSGVGSQATASFTPSAPLTPGEHTLVIEAQDNLGAASTITISGLTVYGDLSIDGRVMNYPNPFKPSTQPTTINYKLTQDANVRLYIYDIGGRMVYSKAFDAGTNGGRASENDVPWDGKNMSGEIVANGAYICVITSDGRILGSSEISVCE
jgi:fibronectin type 3 domain-containing protein